MIDQCKFGENTYKTLTLKIGSRTPNKVNSLNCPKGISVLDWWESNKRFKRYINFSELRVMGLVFCISFYCALHLYEISRKYRKRFLRYRADTSVWAIINKICNPELKFLCSAHPIIVLYICMKFHENISNDL